MNIKNQPRSLLGRDRDFCPSPSKLLILARIFSENSSLGKSTCLLKHKVSKFLSCCFLYLPTHNPKRLFNLLRNKFYWTTSWNVEKQKYQTPRTFNSLWTWGKTSFLEDPASEEGHPIWGNDKIGLEYWTFLLSDAQPSNWLTSLFKIIAVPSKSWN